MAASSDIGSFVTASSVMLGAFGFFYGSFKDRIEAGHEVGAPAADPVAWRRQVATARGARASARTLGLVALVIWALFLKSVVDELQAAWDVEFSLAHYEPLHVVFVALASAWLLIAALMLSQARRLSSTLRTLANARPREG